jgi:chromatin remodeling complex protein RSC6
MAKSTTKQVSTNKVTSEPPVEIPHIDPIVLDENVKKSKKKAKMSNENVDEVVSTEVVSNEVVSIEVPTEVVHAEVLQDSVSDEQLTSSYDKIIKNINELEELNNRNIVNTNLIKLKIKDLYKELMKEKKNADKQLNKKKKNIKKKKSEFSQLMLISDELSDFVGLERGIEVYRPVVNKMVNKYIKDNKLNVGININPDEKLIKLFNYEVGVSKPLTYLNTQSFLKHHFFKKEVVENVV